MVNSNGMDLAQLRARNEDLRERAMRPGLSLRCFDVRDLANLMQLVSFDKPGWSIITDTKVLDRLETYIRANEIGGE